MQKEHKKTIIFDMDGTLYQFKNGGFKNSGIYNVIVENTVSYISKHLNKTHQESEESFNFIVKKYGNSLSIGLEKEFNINRYDYFNFTWNIDPEKYITFDPETQSLLLGIKTKFNIVLLSDAPRIWIDKVLRHLKIEKFFEGNVFSGESDIRKEFGNGFEKLIKTLNVNPEECISIGDQENTDIILAKKSGMKTIYIGEDKSDVADFYIKRISELNNLIPKI